MELWDIEKDSKHKHPMELDLLRLLLRNIVASGKSAKAFNGCFGNRIERIGSWSALGCNSPKLESRKNRKDTRLYCRQVKWTTEMLLSSIATRSGLLLLLLESVRIGCLPLTGESLVVKPDDLKDLLMRLESALSHNNAENAEKIAENREFSEPTMELNIEGDQDSTEEPRALGHPTDEGLARHFSLRNINSFRIVPKNTKRYSGCFGMKIERIGSLSNLGCNSGSRFVKFAVHQGKQKYQRVDMRIGPAQDPRPLGCSLYLTWENHHAYLPCQVLLERYFENLGEEEPAENMAEYDVASQDLDNQASSPWDREKEKEGQWNMGDSRKPFDGYKSDSSRLRDLLLAPRNSRGTSGCFGSRIDRIGSSSSLGCGGMKKGKLLSKYN
ncbi:ANF protein, partial [Polypterus senegalus]